MKGLQNLSRVFLFAGIILLNTTSLLAQGVKFMCDISPAGGMVKLQEKSFNSLYAKQAYWFIHRPFSKFKLTSGKMTKTEK
jgi:hypothetical protein